MDSSTYRHLLGQIKKSCTIPHHNFPSHNLLSLENLTELSSRDGFLSNFPCYQPFPYAVEQSFPLFCGSGVLDEAAELVKRKLNWEMKLKTLKLNNINEAIKKIKKLREGKTVNLSRNLKEYIEHYHNDPEPMFSGNYNWLYTGGCLSFDTVNEDFTLVSANFYSRKPGFNIIKLTKLLDGIQYQTFSQLKAFSQVLQITCKSQHENLIVCVRQKKYLSLFTLNRIDSLAQPVKVWRKKVLGSKLLTCVDVKDNCEEVVLTDSNHDLNIFSVETKHKVCGSSGKKMAVVENRDCWNQVAFGDGRVFWAVRNCLVVLDERDFDSGPKLEFKHTSATNSCEDICSFVKSSTDPNCVYIATTHNILLVDLRNGKPAQRWTHLMKHPPQFLGTVNDGERSELLVLQSQSVNEISGTTNECLKDGHCMFVSRSLPSLFESTKLSLRLSRFHGICLSPTVARRMDFSVTGLLCVKNNEGNIVLFTTNSGGDIFLSNLKKKSSNFHLTEKEERRIMECMKIYESQVEKLSTKEFHKSHLQLINMKHAIQGLKQSVNPKWKKPRKPEIYWKYHEMYSPESLGFCRDILAQKILKVWGYTGGDPSHGVEAISVDDKVREWMDRL